MVDRCVCCGEVIPEGRMVCYACEHSVEYKGINYDKSPIITGKLKDREGGR